jgi:mitogen-activated protein kinase 1/3
MVFIYGTLHKKTLLVWKERFFVLRGTSLSCFKKKGDAEPGRVYVVTGQFSIEKLGKGAGFHLKTPSKTLRLRADSDKEEAEWVTTLETVIRNEKEKVSLRPLRANTKLWWAETKQGQFCFELDSHYEMRKTIGSGGYGVVVSAINRRDDTKVAVKKVVSAFDDVLVAKRMVREIRLLRQFEHDNIVRIVDMLPPPSVESFEDVYIVLERMDTDLHHIIYSGQHLKEAHMQFFMYQMLCGLKYIHSAQVIHRDLKPANVLVNTTCDLKLCDFGLARSLLMADGSTAGTANDSTGDSGGASPKMTEYVVTRWWRAPEVFLEADYNVAIDVWSAGCILAEMLQKKPLFMGNNTAQMLKLIVGFCGKVTPADLAFVSNRKARTYMLDMPEAPPTDLPAKFPAAGAAALDLLQRMLQFNPAQRISIDEALAHPWLTRFHTPEHEAVAQRPAELSAVETAPLTRAALQRLMFEDVCAFRPECLEQVGGSSSSSSSSGAVGSSGAVTLPPPPGGHPGGVNTVPLPPLLGGSGHSSVSSSQHGGSTSSSAAQQQQQQQQQPQGSMSSSSHSSSSSSSSSDDLDDDTGVLSDVGGSVTSATTVDTSAAEAATAPTTRRSSKSNNNSSSSNSNSNSSSSSSTEQVAASLAAVAILAT